MSPSGGGQFLRSSGTVLKVFDKARVALTNGTTFADNTKGPALVVTGDAMVTVLGAAFNNNSAGEASGGAISVSGSASVALINSSLANNSAPDADAGALLIAGGASVTVTACKFTSNLAEYNGASIFAGDSSRLRVTSCNFTKNQAKYFAGAGIFAIDQASVAVGNSSFIENIAGCSGGGISAGGNTHVTIKTCNFERNLIQPVNRAMHGLGGGGLVANQDANVLVQGSSFVSNKVIGSSGGGISARHRSMVNVSVGTAFISNSAEVEGGAINIHGESKFVVDGGVTFYNNSANYAGEEIRASGDASLLLGDANIQATSPSVSWTRKICGVGEVKSGPSGTCMSCPVNTYALDNTSATCSPCPESISERGAVCAGGALVYPLSGFWHSSPYSTQFHQCPTPDACLPGSGARCADGHEGHLCMSCSKGFAMRFASSKCRKCSSTGKIIAAYLGAAVVLCLLVLISLHFALRENVMDGHSRSSQFCKLLIRHAQYVLIVAHLKINWPESLQAAFSLVNWVFSLGGPEVASLDCLLAAAKPLGMPLAMKRIFINLPAPLGVGLVVALLWLLIVKACAHCGKPISYHAHFSSLRSVWPVCALVCLNFFFPWLARIGLGFFACITIDKPGSQYATANARHGYFASSIEQACYTGWHRKYALSLGVVTLLLFSVGIPVGLWVLLYRSRSKEDPATPSRLSFLYCAYRPQHYYFEVVSTLQILAGVAISVFSLSLGSFYSLLLLNTAFVLFGSMELIFKPYMCPHVQRMSLLSCACLYLTTQMSLTLFSSGGVAAPTSYSETAGALGMLLHLVFVSACLAFMVSHSPVASKLWGRVTACFGMRRGSGTDSGNKAMFEQVAPMPARLSGQLEPHTGP